ncbi:metal ABC transporter solute-binding protein, Zn/Mn family [Robertmurraya massiliosenegalensis]|uniref:metal ABC transporter solute-binding protein, Zn/Mn family n=1 Tax=Robertmurraya massiliosenegalensis TaxID=1287657 RepID=UPI0003000A29|nr:zinc ABC transporter substrate-binding protein [Robertmurraya massiliosenegalensis]
MQKKISLFIMLFILVLAGCGSKEKNSNANQENEKLHIYTTVYPLQYFAEEIGKEYVTVDTIYPPGADEHTFEPSQKDMIELAKSDLFIYVGLGLEGFVNKAKQTLENENVTLVAAGEHIHFDEDSHEEDTYEHAHEEEEHHDDGHNHGDIDPHVWIDPLYAKELAEAIKDELVTQLPEHKVQLETNYNALAEQLDELNNQFVSLVDQAEHKEMIVSHAAYGYWEKRYGIKQISISGISSSNEPTQKQLKEIISEAKEHQLNHIFFEQNVSSKLAEIVQDELQAEPLFLHNLSVLTDNDIKENKTYFSIMEDNLKALETAFIHE